MGLWPALKQNDIEVSRASDEKNQHLFRRKIPKLKTNLLYETLFNVLPGCESPDHVHNSEQKMSVAHLTQLLIQHGRLLNKNNGDQKCTEKRKQKT